MFIVDAHLDLAYNVTRGRDVTLPANRQPVADNEIPTVGLPDLRAGNVGLICATIFCEPASAERPGYTNADEARFAALVQLKWYQDQQAAGQMRFEVTSVGQTFLSATELRQTGMSAPSASAKPLRAILLLEGADALRTPADVAEWFAAGLRIVGLAWKRTRYAGGTGALGPLTPAGIELVRELDRFGIIHDASHLAEESFWQLLDQSGGPIIASHSNCRAIVPTDRQLSDEMIRAIARTGGVIGINFFDKFLLPPNEYGKRRATLADVVRHVRHICDLTGSAKHAALGTDMDGGLGREQIPVEIASSADLPRVADALSSAGFDDEAVCDVMGRNWLAFFKKNLGH
jgi:membrane dipeptidase